jgi:hypothetical protein
MKVGKLFKGQYLKASDIDGEVVYQIESIGAAMLKNNTGQEEEKPLLHFRGTDTGLVLNVTNANAIVKALGSDETDDWLGRKITLYTTDVEFRGDWVAAIRVKTKAPSETVAKKDAPDGFEDDDIPF